MALDPNTKLVIDTITYNLRASNQYAIENSTGTVVLAASTAVIGKLAANSGVDIGDVDVLTLPDVDINDISKGTQTNDVKITLDSEVVAVDATGQGDVPITLDSEKVVLGASTEVVGKVNPVTNYLIEVSRGNISGHSYVHKFGRNDAVPNGSWAFINLLGSANGLLSAATAVRIKAGGNANDASAGSGAREITVQGITTGGTEQSVTIATAGTSASAATSITFWRVHRAWVSAAGTYGGANTSDITIENSAGGTDLIKIGSSEGQTQYAGYTIPSGKTGYLLSVHVTVDSNKRANIRIFTRDNITDTSAPVSAKRLKLFWDGLTESFRYSPKGPELSINALSDIWVEAYGDGAASEVSADFELLLVDN